MDVLKFKQIAGSMKYAFGVQNLLEVKDIPKGTSVIAQEFSPGRPEPTPIETIMQQTIDMTQAKLDFQDGEAAEVGGQKQDEGNKDGGMTESQAIESQMEAKQQAELNQLAKTIALKMKDQIEDGAIEIEALGQQLIIRIREKGAFPSGSAFLQPKFRPVLVRVAEILKDVPGEITISGHTDDEAIKSELYRSNWDLSSQRAVSVAHEMIRVKGFDQHRLLVVGYADSKPLFENTDSANRGKNRRVEISVMQGKAQESDEINVAQ